MRIFLLSFVLLLCLSLPTPGLASAQVVSPVSAPVQVIADGENDPPVQPDPKSKREKAEAKKKKKKRSGQHQ